VAAIRRLRHEIDVRVDVAERWPAATVLMPRLSDLRERLEAIEEDLVQPKLDGVRGGGKGEQHWPRKLNTKLEELWKIVATGDAAPTTQALEVGERLLRQVAESVSAYRALASEGVDALNQESAALGVPAITPYSAGPSSDVADRTVQ